MVFSCGNPKKGDPPKDDVCSDCVEGDCFLHLLFASFHYYHLCLQESPFGEHSLELLPTIKTEHLGFF